MVLVFNRFLVFVVLGDAMLALLLDVVHILDKLVDMVFNLTNLLFISPRRLVPDIMLVHPFVVFNAPLVGERSIFDALMATVIIKMMIIAVPVRIMMPQAQVNYMNRLIVDEDIDVVNDFVHLEYIICA